MTSIVHKRSDAHLGDKHRFSFRSAVHTGAVVPTLPTRHSEVPKKKKKERPYACSVRVLEEMAPCSVDYKESEAPRHR